MAAVPARAALAGNPSDGYGGAVLAITIPALCAEVSVGPHGSPSDDILTAATRERFYAEYPAQDAGGPIALATTIPRSVGLGGSSAIVIATLRALCHRHTIPWEPDAMAALALSIEVDDLDIAAGLQDRLVQCHGGLVFMEFSELRPWAERLSPDGLPPLLVAWRTSHSEPSGVVHASLRERFDRDDPGVRAALTELGDLARRARRGLLDDEVGELRAAVDGSFDIRRSLLELDPRHIELVDVARAAGAAVNYTGSGGAVVCVCNDLGHRDAVAQALGEIGAETAGV